jgi:hypothetical protein
MLEVDDISNYYVDHDLHLAYEFQDYLDDLTEEEILKLENHMEI